MRTEPLFTLIAVIVSTATLPETVAGQLPARPELRGTWLNQQAFQASRRRTTTLDLVTDANLNTIFALAPSVNGNLGGGSSDAFEALIREAARRGLGIHGWLLCHRRKGRDVELDFSDPIEQRAQADWAVTLLDRYPGLNGVHLDYIRYREAEVPDLNRLDGLTRTVQGIREAMRAKHPDKSLTAAVFVAASAGYLGSLEEGRNRLSNTPAWFRQWYNDHLDNWFATAYRRNSRLQPTWALGPNHLRYGQDSVTWLREDLVDGIMPMQYTSNDAVWQEELDLWRSFLGGKLDGVYTGLGFLTEQGRPSWKHDPDSLVRHINYARSHGWPGGVIYRLGFAGDLDRQLVTALTRGRTPGHDAGPFAAPARSPMPLSTTRDSRQGDPSGSDSARPGREANPGQRE